VASRLNYNTEIGLPLEIVGAPQGTEVLVLEHAMRGAGQIAELAAISRPDVGVIVNVGPVHLELLGSLEAIAAAKAELIAALADGITLIDDSYNANPMSMRAALDDLVATAARPGGARTVAVLGDMLELGPDERDYHVQIGEHAGAVGVDVLVTVGALAEAI